jgi:Tfp pilus assembly protein PilF
VWARRFLLVVGAVACFCAPPRVQAEARARTVEAWRMLVEHGDYAVAEAGLRARLEQLDRHGKVDSRTRALLIRVLQETGRYAEVEREAGLLTPADPALALTLAAEALTAHGERDAAERSLRSALVAQPAALRAKLRLGQLLWNRGQREPARRLLESVMSDRARHKDPDLDVRIEALTLAATAARILGHVHEANDRFREAAELDRSRVETQLEWAQLFIDKYDLQHASDAVQAALAQNPRSARGQVLSARIAFLSAHDFVGAEVALDQALAVNPQLSAAYVLRASMALRDMDIARAETALGQALAINPLDLEALSVRAAARFLDDDPRGFAQLERRVLDLDPRYGSFYTKVAEFAEWEHRYPEIVSMFRRALKSDPEDASARAGLGLSLLRMGDEQQGLVQLRKAWERDHFNVQVYNTLNLYESAIATDYTEQSAGPFKLRLHKTERAVLAPYLVPLLEQAYAQMRERWGFTPTGPLRVELYADRAQFSVRTTGLPNAGVQGVSFGKVITGLSPRGGPFNWGQIVWHELCHVFHLQLSKNHVPRWFTEGLAEYETSLARAEWKREDDYALWQALQSGKLPPLASMNRAFTQAETSDDLLTAYFYAYRAVQHIVERHGWGAVRRLLVAFGEGQKLEAASQAVLGVTLEQLDESLHSALAERLDKYDREFAPDLAAYGDVSAARALAAQKARDPDALAALALSEVNAEHLELAEHSALAALKLAPQHRLAQFALARVALARGDARKAERCLTGILDSGADGYVLRLLLARGALARGNPEGAAEQAEAAVRFDPDRSDAHKLLLELAAKLGDESLALRALGALADLDQHDSLVHVTYLALLRKNRDWPAVIREGETALYIAPENPAVHLHLGEAYVETGAFERGLGELDRALALGYSQPGLVRLARARAYLLRHDRENALRELKLALTSDPTLDSRAKSLITP